MWRKLSANQFRWKCWEDEFVLYNRDSGDTHLLEAFYAHVWQVLSEIPIADEQIRKGLEELGYGANDLDQGLSKALDSLEQIGLVSSSTK